MKLIHIPGACSLAVHIALRKVGAPVELLKYDPSTGNVDGETPIRSLTAKPYVPTLFLPDGEVLAETAAILLSLDELYPEARLMPENPAKRRAAREWLVFTSSELHKTFAPLFSPATKQDQIAAIRQRLAVRFDHVAHALGSSGPFLLGETPFAPDMYLFVMTLWANVQDIDLGHWPSIARYQADVAAVEAVSAALRAEGLPVPDARVAA